MQQNVQNKGWKGGLRMLIFFQRLINLKIFRLYKFDQDWKPKINFDQNCLFDSFDNWPKVLGIQKSFQVAELSFTIILNVG